MGAVRRYLRENGIEVDDVAAEKPPAKVYVDDRALLFDGNPKGLLEKIQQFRPWQEGGPLRGKPPVPNCRKCIAHVYERTNDGWREDEFVAWFHTWGSTFEEFDNGAVPVTTGIVEDEHGKQTEYRITGSQEANPMEFKLSDDSPFGRAVVGKAAGETFTVNAPAGSFTMKVVSVSREG